jgi:hypothetical protein
MKSEKSDKIEKVLAKYDLNSNQAKNLNEFVESIHNFISEDRHYYSDMINKKLFNLASKTGLMLLRSEKLSYELKLIESEIEKNKYKSKKTSIDKMAFEFKNNFEKLQKEVDKLYDEAMEIIKLIQSEYEKKQPV